MFEIVGCVDLSDFVLDVRWSEESPIEFIYSLMLVALR